MKRRDEQSKSAEGGFGAEDRIEALFQPDTLLHDQYFDNIRRRGFLEPERSLMLAVFEDGIRSFQDNVAAEDVKKRALFEEAREWLWSEDMAWPFSFASLCAYLGFDAAYIRRGLIHWRERKLSGAPKGRPTLKRTKRKAA